MLCILFRTYQESYIRNIRYNTRYVRITIQAHPAQPSAARCSAVRCCALPCGAVPCCAVLCYASSFVHIKINMYVHIFPYCGLPLVKGPNKGAPGGYHGFLCLYICISVFPYCGLPLIVGQLRDIFVQIVIQATNLAHLFPKSY